MALSPRLEVRQSQSLTLTPQLMQSIRLLQLNHLELNVFVDAELLRNPLLEREDGSEPAEPAEAPAETTPPPAETPQTPPPDPEPVVTEEPTEQASEPAEAPADPPADEPSAPASGAAEVPEG